MDAERKKKESAGKRITVRVPVHKAGKMKRIRAETDGSGILADISTGQFFGSEKKSDRLAASFWQMFSIEEITEILENAEEYELIAEAKADAENDSAYDEERVLQLAEELSDRLTGTNAFMEVSETADIQQFRVERYGCSEDCVALASFAMLQMACEKPVQLMRLAEWGRLRLEQLERRLKSEWRPVIGSAGTESAHSAQTE